MVSPINQQTRPFHPQLSKFSQTKHFSLDTIRECRELLRIRTEVQSLMRKCQSISDEIEVVVSELTDRSDITLDRSDRDYISKQPDLLNPR